MATKSNRSRTGQQRVPMPHSVSARRSVLGIPGQPSPTRTTSSMRMCWPTHPHRRSLVEAAAPRDWAGRGPAGAVPVPQGPGRDQGADPGAAARQPGAGVPGAIGLFTKPASGISLAFLLRFLTAQGRVAVAGANVGLASVGRLYRWRQRLGAARPADVGAPGPLPDHPRARGHARRAQRSDRRPGPGNRHAVRRASRPARPSPACPGRAR
jgi:hypothetical protein